MSMNIFKYYKIILIDESNSVFEFNPIKLNNWMKISGNLDRTGAVMYVVRKSVF